MKKMAYQRILLGLGTFIAALPAFAQEASDAVAKVAPPAGGVDVGHGLIAIGAGLAIGLAAFGGGLAQGKTAAAALDGIARNPAAQPKIFTPMIIGLALIESLVIYALVIAFFLQGKIVFPQ